MQWPKVITTEVEPAGGGRPHVEEARRGTPVVLLHAGLLDRHMWDYEFWRLAVSRRVIRYGLRGHGASTDASEPFSPIDDLTAVMDALDLDRADLIGLCSGGRA
jgi:pimeloyl-ACP methyl ester carboxylesterase